MKIIIIVAIFLLAFVGCSDVYEKSRQAVINNRLQSIQKNGHSYLMTEGFGPDRVIHDESCWCRVLERKNRYSENK